VGSLWEAALALPEDERLRAIAELLSPASGAEAERAAG
jgi:hypothetical protein